MIRWRSEGGLRERHLDESWTVDPGFVRVGGRLADDLEWVMKAAYMKSRAMIAFDEHD